MGTVGLGPAWKSLGPSGEAENRAAALLQRLWAAQLPELSPGQEVILSEF